MHRAFRVYRTEHRIVLSISVSLFAHSWAPTYSFTSSSFDAISLYIRKRNTHSCSFARIERLRPESKSESVGQRKKRDAYSVTFCWLLPAFFRPMSLLKWFSTCSTLARNGYANKRQRGNRKNNRRSQELQPNKQPHSNRKRRASARRRNSKLCRQYKKNRIESK